MRQRATGGSRHAVRDWTQIAVRMFAPGPETASGSGVDEASGADVAASIDVAPLRELERLAPEIAAVDLVGLAEMQQRLFDLGRIDVDALPLDVLGSDVRFD